MIVKQPIFRPLDAGGSLAEILLIQLNSAVGKFSRQVWGARSVSSIGRIIESPTWEAILMDPQIRILAAFVEANSTLRASNNLVRVRQFDVFCSTVHTTLWCGLRSSKTPHFAFPTLSPLRSPVVGLIPPPGGRVLRPAFETSPSIRLGVPVGNFLTAVDFVPVAPAEPALLGLG